MSLSNQVLQVNVARCIRETMDRVGMKEELREVHDGINMSYNFIGKYVGYDQQRLETSHTQYASCCSFEMYIKTMTLHELGHAIDLSALEASLARTIEIFTMKRSTTQEEIYRTPELLKVLIEEDEMNLAFEVTAWKNAAKLNEQYQIVNQTDFQKIESNSLETYQKLYCENLQSYNELLSNKITN